MPSMFASPRSKNQTNIMKSSTVRALPALWYTSSSLYELERRAVFSKKWMLITHQTRLKQPGDWIKYDVTGYEFIICRDRHDAIHGFHNICRHRAFPIVTADKGQSRIFACKYHGWSYSLDGRLAKAPGYQELEHFDKSNNSLLPIHIHIDVNGFIWVNLDARTKPEIAWKDDFFGVDTQKRFEGIEFSQYNFDHTWEIEGKFNWKLLGDNYNECYHCQTAHPDVPAMADLSAYSVDTKGAHIQHFSNPEDRVKVDTSMKIASTFYYPNASMTVSRDFLFIQRVVPMSAKSTFLRYEVYRHKDAIDSDFENIDALFKRVMAEDKWLCNSAQKNIDVGIFINGELHPRMEKGPLFFQQSVREQLKAHRQQEVIMKHEIWPARQIVSGPDEVSQDDIDFCSGLACGVDEAAVAW